MRGNIQEGQRFGKLTADCYYYSDDRHRAFWICSCDCGNDDVIVLAANLKRTTGSTTSCGCVRRLPNNGAEVGNIFFAYRARAKRRGCIWKLTKEFFESLVRKNCFYCGSEPSNVKTLRQTIEPFIYNGVDRQDNTKGYTIDNVVTCCWICNRAKLDMPYEDYINWIERIKNER